MLPGVVPIGITVIGPPTRFEITPAGGGTTESRNITGINIDRLTNYMVLYRSPLTQSSANEWGCELRVTGGGVDYKRLQGNTTPTAITPSTSFVLSGHNTEADFLNNFGVGATVTFYDASNNVVST